MLELTTDQISSQQLFPISSYELSKFINWMCVEDPFSQIWSHIYVAGFWKNDPNRTLEVTR